MRQRLALIVAFVFVGTLAVSACGAQPAQHPDGRAARCSGTGFQLSLVSDHGGQPTPVLAAAWFSHHGGVPDVPAHGWRVTSHGGRTAVVASGQVILHVIKGSDRTWQVDSGLRCAVPLSQHGPTASSRG